MGTAKANLRAIEALPACLLSLSLSISRPPPKMVKGGIPVLCFGCTVFYDYVQCIIVVCDVLCVCVGFWDCFVEKFHLMIGWDLLGLLCFIEGSWGWVFAFILPSRDSSQFCEKLFDILSRNLSGDPEICSIQREIEWSEMSAKHECMELELKHSLGDALGCGAIIG